MYSKFPLSMERLPRPHRCGCLSLRAGCILTALICIVYAVLAMSQCVADAVAWADAGAGGEGGEGGGAAHWAYVGGALAVLATSLALSALMLVGALREKAWMMQPWVVFKAVQLAAGVLLLVGGAALRPATALPLLLAEFLAILVRFYMLAVVSSCCRQLEEEALAPLHQHDHDPTYTAL